MGTIMRLTVTITDKAQLELVERLRGNIPAEQFAARLVAAGLRVAQDQARKAQQAQRIDFPATKPEFKSLNVAAITAALKDKNPDHPVKLEVSRLVTDYSAQLATHAKANGNKLPQSLRVNASAAIEKVAVQIVVEGWVRFDGSQKAPIKRPI